MRQRRLMNQINVVPYIDVMLVLLVIFMVTAPMLPTGTVDLPSVAKASLPKVPPMVITVKGEDRWTLGEGAAATGGPLIESDDLVARLQAAQETNPDRGVVISASKNVRYEAVMKVMDLLQRNQINKVGLLVQSGQ